MTVTFMDRALFALRRFYNRTVGAHIIGWTHDRLTIFGISIMTKHAVDVRHSKQASANLKVGLSADEYREVCQTLAMISVLPWPELPDGTYSHRQMDEHGIRLILNWLYIFRA